MLTQTRLKQLFLYEPETGNFIRLCAPGKRSDLIGTVAGSPSSQGYILINVDNRKYRAHRLAFLYMTGEWPPLHVDHENNIKSDNRYTNLRHATKAQNEYNKPINSSNTSGVKGVYWNNAANKWQAYITVNGANKYLGIFNEFDDATAARKKAEDDSCGMYAYRKPIEGGRAHGC